MKNILIVGLGHMGTALLDGMLKHGVEADNISVMSPSGSAASKCDARKVKMYQSIKGLPETPDVIILAVRPHQAAEVLPLYKQFDDALFISVMAALSLEKMAAWLGGGAKIVRAMPNMGSTISAGMTLLCTNSSVSAQQKDQAEKLMHSVGETVWVNDEDLFEKATIISGCGPAWFFLLMESMVEIGMNAGLDKETATKLAVVTGRGSTLFAAEVADKTSPQELRNNMELPGSLTGEGTKVLLEAKFKEIISKAAEASATRARQIARNDKT